MSYELSAYDILRYFKQTEKSTYVAAFNKAVFVVDSSATKEKIKKSASDIFGSNVLSVNIVNVKSRSRVFKGKLGKTKRIKKAYITFENLEAVKKFMGI